jgi:hypothetical protein
MMTDVARFCGCLYSFDGGAAACPRCGEWATVRTGSARTCADGGPAPRTVLCSVSQDGQNGQTAGIFSRYDRVPVRDLPDDVILCDALAGDPRMGPGDAGLAMFDFVTGASSGVGDVFARRIADDGWYQAITHAGQPAGCPARARRRRSERPQRD